MIARSVSLRLLYNSRDISADIAPFLESFTFTDSFNSADDLQITLCDPKGLWRGEWFPDKGAELTASIRTEGWAEDGSKGELYCGRFYIDQIDISGPVETVSIKAKSVPVASSGDSGGEIQKQLRTRAWENTTLKTIAAQIAREAGMELFFLLKNDIPYTRQDQQQRSDLGFLQWLGDRGGFAVKVSDRRLIITGREELEKAAPAAAVKKPVKQAGAFGQSRLSSWSFSSSTAQKYKACRVSSYDPVNKVTYSAEAQSHNAETGQTLVISERCESQADAERLARARLKSASLKDVTGSLNMMGNVAMSAGLTISVEGFGVFDGLYFIDSAVHSADSGGYRTALKIHRGESS